jgi:hypothetical protein
LNCRQVSFCCCANCLFLFFFCRGYGRA